MTVRLRIGLTGGIASGKSAVARRFAAHSMPVIDADEASRAVVKPGSDGLARLVACFGTGILAAGGELDRAALRRIVFADGARRRELEALLHPLIRQHMDAALDAATAPYAILVVPLLVEGADRSRFDRILVVDVPESLQIERLMARDGGSRAEAEAILAAQANRAARLAAADDVIENSGSLAALHAAVDTLHERYLEVARRLAPHGAI